MPRLIILLLILAALVVLTVQNLSTSMALVILSGKTTALPFGLLLLGAICIGALVTLVLYTLVGLWRPPESKYRPMGRRVPYPDSPGSTTLPTSGPPYPQADSKADPSYSRSSAFVTEPAPAQTVSSPQDKPPGASAPNSFISSPPPDAPTVKKKSDRNPTRRQSADDDWGTPRTAEQRNSWDAEDEGYVAGSAATSANQASNQASGQKRGMFDFIRGGSARESPDRLADDIATGWDSAAGSSAASSAEGYGDRRPNYDEELDQGWESFDHYDNYDNPPPGYTRRVYSDGLYGADGDTADHFEDSQRESDSEPDQIGPDGVYEADYRVIAPPTRSLDDDEDPYYSD